MSFAVLPGSLPAINDHLIYRIQISLVKLFVFNCDDLIERVPWRTRDSREAWCMKIANKARGPRLRTPIAFGGSGMISRMKSNKSNIRLYEKTENVLILSCIFFRPKAQRLGYRFKCIDSIFKSWCTCYCKRNTVKSFSKRKILRLNLNLDAIFISLLVWNLYWDIQSTRRFLTMSHSLGISYGVCGRVMRQPI